MATLTVTQTTDFRDPPIETGIDRLLFADPDYDSVTATFAPQQFGTGLISLTLSVTGGTADDRIRIFGPATSVVSLDLSGWTFTDWSPHDSILIAGGGRADRIRGTGQADSIAGGGSSDTLYGGDGNDTLQTGSGNADRLYGEEGNDSLIATSYDASLYGGAGNDRLLGGVNGDSLIGGLGNDTMEGGTGNDSYDVDSPGDVIVEAAGGGYDTIRSSIDFSLEDLPDVENLILTFDEGTARGNDTANELIGQHNALLYGLGGPDRLTATSGSTLIGGDGSDYYLLDDIPNITMVEEAGTAAGEADTIEVTRRPIFALPDNIENLVIRRSGMGVGNAADNTLTVYLYQDQSILVGGDGNDTYVIHDQRESTVIIIEEDSANSGVDTVIFYGTSITLPDNIENAQAPEGASLVGNALDNVLSGRWIQGESGNDTITAAPWYGSNLDGGDGDDSITGLSSGDTLRGGAGDDTLIGGAGSDTYRDYDASDLIIEEAGAPGLDVIEMSVSFKLTDMPNIEGLILLGTADFSGEGTDSANTLAGNTGANLLKGWGGADTLSGNAGNDTLRGGDSNDSLLGGGGIDTLFGEAGDDFIDGGAESDTLRGNDGNDTLNGSTGSDTLAGDNGNDSLDGGNGNDTMYGGNGNDLLYERAGLNVLAGDAGNDTLIGGFEKDHLDGGSENDSLNGWEGDDTLLGGNGNDTLFGGLHNDSLDGGSGSDSLDGSSGADTLTGGTGDDWYRIDHGNDQVVETAGPAGGIDTVTTGVSIAALAAYVERAIATPGPKNIGLAGNDLANELIGNDARNMLSGLDGDDTLVGGRGNDTLIGGTGADRLEGGLGNDLYIDAILGGPQSDTIVEASGGGTDTLQSQFSSSLAGYYVENLVLTGNAAIDGSGNAFANSITGNLGANVLDGLAGNDTIDGGNGADTIMGGDGRDELIGGNQNDIIYGQGGADTISGGTGHDTMNGGGDADVFRFLETNSGNDRIDGFSVTVDRFVLTGNSFTGMSEANGNTTLFHRGGSILITGVTGYSIADWNALVLPNAGARTAVEDVRITLSAEYSPLPDDLPTLHGDYFA